MPALEKLTVFLKADLTEGGTACIRIDLDRHALERDGILDIVLPAVHSAFCQRTGLTIKRLRLATYDEYRAINGIPDAGQTED